MKGFIFEQEYHAKKARIPGEEFIDTLDGFLAAIDEDVHLNISINNRAGGNAPIIARMVSDQFLKRLNKVGR